MMKCSFRSAQCPFQKRPLIGAFSANQPFFAHALLQHPSLCPSEAQSRELEGGETGGLLHGATEGASRGEGEAG